MMSGIEKWLDKLKEAEITSIIQDGKRKVHFTFPDSSELAEEYSIQSGEIIVRKWRKKSTLGASLPWEFEIGNASYDNKFVENLDLRESSSNPIFTRQDTLKSFQWRVRNIPYPLETYDISLDEEQRVVIIRTTNKKFYKKFNIPDMDRANLKLNKSSLHHTHANNTLIVTYDKPDEIIKMEKMILNEINSKSKANKDGDVECKQS